MMYAPIYGDKRMNDGIFRLLYQIIGTLMIRNDTAEKVKASSEDIKASSEKVKVFSEKVKVFSEKVKVFSEDIKVFSEEIKVFSEDIKAISSARRVFFFILNKLGLGWMRVWMNGSVKSSWFPFGRYSCLVDCCTLPSS